MSRARAIEPVTEGAQYVPPANPAGLDAPEIVGLKHLTIFRGADGQDRPAIVTKVVDQDHINAVVFGTDHDDSEAGLKVGLVRKGDHWITG